MPDLFFNNNPFKKRFYIGNRAIGKGEPCLIIAEAGVAHFGDMGLARELVQLAVDGDADAFKIQTFDIDALFVQEATEWRERLRPRNLTLDQVLELKQLCDDAGLLFIMTPHDETRIQWLKELDVPAIKIGSGERNNTPFIRKLAQIGKPIILSTGMYTEEDVLEARQAVQAEGCDELALLHCVSSYPTPDSEVSLSSIDRLKVIFQGPVGFSDHTKDFLAVYGAVARGAKIIEKHITILQNVPNAQDWKVSATPNDFPRLVQDIRRIETMLGDYKKSPAISEASAEHSFLKSLVAKQDLPQGHKISEADLLAKRPGGGIPPNQISELIGRSLNYPLKMDERITWQHFTV